MEYNGNAMGLPRSRFEDPMFDLERGRGVAYEKVQEPGFGFVERLPVTLLVSISVQRLARTSIFTSPDRL